MRSMRYGIVGAALASLTLSPPVFGAGGETVDRSTPASTLELSYDLYVGGIALGKVAMSAHFQGTDYKAISTLETSGIVNAFWQSKIEAASNGLVRQGDIRPALYDSYSQNRKDERRQVTLTFGPEGPKSLFSDPPYPEARYPVSEEQQKKTLDPLSAAVFLTNSVNGENVKPCEAVAPIFDGRRRYDVGLSFVKKADVRMDNGLYRGPVSVCRVKYMQIAGYQQTLVEQGKKLPEMFAWVTPVRSRLDPSRQYMLPLRVWAETEYGIVVALASAAKVDGMAVGTQN
jgi:Protein of unknown function (DUF3108)